ncbi:MAG: hypothetical protein R2741_15390 [Methanolobus sp.]
MGTAIIKPFKHLSSNLIVLGAIFAFTLMLVEPFLVASYVPLLYFGVIFGKVEAEITFPMTLSDDVYCLLEGELIEDTEHNVDSNISLIVAGVNYCSFWKKSDYLNHFKHSFQLTQDNIISQPIPALYMAIGNFLEQSKYSKIIYDKIDEIQKNILIDIYVKYEDVIRRNSKTPILRSHNLKYMTSSKIVTELEKYLEVNQDLGKYLNTVILNQEISDMIKSRKLIFEKFPQNNYGTEINNILQTIYSMYYLKNPKRIDKVTENISNLSQAHKIEN